MFLGLYLLNSCIWKNLSNDGKLGVKLESLPSAMGAYGRHGSPSRRRISCLEPSEALAHLRWLSCLPHWPRACSSLVVGRGTAIGVYKLPCYNFKRLLGSKYMKIPIRKFHHGLILLFFSLFFCYNFENWLLSYWQNPNNYMKNFWSFFFPSRTNAILNELMSCVKY